MNIFGRSDKSEHPDDVAAHTDVESGIVDYGNVDYGNVNSGNVNPERVDPANVDPGNVNPGSVDIVRREERLRAGVERVPVERVRISTRVVTETSTLTVEVRREELVVERLPLLQGGQTSSEDLAQVDKRSPVLELVLREEVPEVVTRVRPVEQVRVYLDRVAGEQVVEATLAAEQVEVLDSREDFLR